MKKPIAYVCPHCGSTDVLADAHAGWNPTTQEWELQNVYPEYFCDACGETLITPIVKELMP